MSYCSHCDDFILPGRGLEMDGEMDGKILCDKVACREDGVKDICPCCKLLKFPIAVFKNMRLCISCMIRMKKCVDYLEEFGYYLDMQQRKEFDMSPSIDDDEESLDNDLDVAEKESHPVDESSDDGTFVVFHAII
mgnify:FL=1